MAYRLLPVSDLPNVDFPTIQVSAALPGACPETMASSVATPLENQFSTIAAWTTCPPRSARARRRSRCSSTCRATSTRAAHDVQSAISAAGRQLRPTCRRLRRTEGQSRRPAGPLPDADLEVAAAVPARRVRRDDDGAADLDGRRRRAGPGLRAAEVCRPHPARPAALARAASASTTSRSGHQRERQPPDRHPLRRRSPRSRVQANGQIFDAAATSRSSSLTATARRSASTTSRPSRRRRERQDAAGSTTSGPSPRDLASSRARTPSRSPTRCESSCRPSRSSFPRPSLDIAVRPLRSRSATRSTTSSSRCS